MDKGYTLPNLPYDYAALEPHYSARLLALHHDKHHAAYVTGANTTLEKLAEARERTILQPSPKQTYTGLRTIALVRDART